MTLFTHLKMQPKEVDLKKIIKTQKELLFVQAGFSLASNLIAVASDTTVINADMIKELQALFCGSVARLVDENMETEDFPDDNEYELAYCDMYNQLYTSFLKLFDDLEAEVQ